MEIRLANLADLNACVALDDSFETEYVWQMEERHDGGLINVNFRQTRLPRPMKVRGNISRDAFLANFQNGGIFFVAEEGDVRGFVDFATSSWNQVVHVNNLLVAPAHRRRGIGAKLMRAAIDWARQQQFRVMMLDTSTKNFPAICFYQKLGFAFCGFNDRLYPNRDIALMFALNLR